jgi:PhnB protein
MSVIVLSPYLNFQGNCEEAMNFYKAVLGGELEISRFSDFPDPSLPEDYKDKVMHATLKGDVITFMASDGRPGGTVNFGDSVSLSLAGDDEATITSYFNGLSEGGTIIAPLQKQVWGDMFGMFTDKYGINWLVNITAQK